MKTACFTGHRPDKLGGYNEDSDIAKTVKNELRKTISILKNKGYTRFISGMALGIDQWAAEIVLEDQELVLVAAIPCLEQERKWTPESKNRYKNIISKAHEVHTLSEVYHPGVMQERNKWMVNESEVVVAVWNGTSGGTANCVKYAQEINKEIMRIQF